MVRVYELTDAICDKCKKPISTEASGMNIYESGRGRDRNIINLHYSCLDKLVKKSKKDAQPVAADPVLAEVQQ